MVTVYFLLAMIFIIYEGFVAMNPEELLNSFKITRNEDSAGIKFNFLIFINMIYTVWVIIGIIGSSQTFLFSLLLIMGTIAYIFKIRKTEKQVLTLTVIDALVSFTLLTTIMYRHFYHT